MTVFEAIGAIRQEGTIEAEGDRIKLRVPAEAKIELRPAIEVIRREKQIALELLRPSTPASLPPAEPGVALGAILCGHALELWSDQAGGRLFIVADERDYAKLKERRGEVLTVDELRLVVRIDDVATATEVLRWKRTFDGVLSEDHLRRRTSRD